MGIVLSEHELLVLASLLDEDGTGIIDLNVFVRWMCDDDIDSTNPEWNAAICSSYV